MLSARRPQRRPPVKPDTFQKTSLNFSTMSRTASNKTTGHAPSTLMLERMHEAATDLVILATTTQGWNFTHERNGAMLYEMAGRNLPPNVTTARKFGRGAGHSSDYFLARAVTTVQSGVAQILDLLHSSTTDDFRLVMRQVFREYFQHGMTLDRLTCTTPPPFAQDPDAGVEGSRQSFSEDDAYSVNWLTLKAQPKLDTVENHRDFTLVCYQDVFSRHDSGVLERVGRGTARTRSNTLNFQPQSRLVGVHVLSSVNFQGVPQLSIPDCTDRLHFRNSGFVIEETSEPNVLRLSLLLSLLPTKATLKYARKYQRWLQTLASCVGNLAQTLRPEVIIQCMSKLTWKQSDHCFMCLKMFRAFRRCHHCRFCGEAVCSSCSSMINMAGYEVKDGSSSTLATSAATSQVSSREKVANLSSSGDVWQMTPADGIDATRNRNLNSRSLREARGCSACIADLQHGLTASAVMRMRRNLDSRSNASSDNPVFARSRTGQSASNGDDDVISYDSSENVSYERRLGSIATYIPSAGGLDTEVEENGPFTASMLGLTEPVDEYLVTPDEMQDRFPAVDEAAPPRFRTVSDPDQLRRMRNVSDPELPHRLQDKHSMVSISTASSSFSRSSNDRYTTDNVSQYSRGTTMSDGLSGDPSRDLDVLALARLSVKSRALDEFEHASVQRPSMSDSQTYEQLSCQILEETDREIEAESNAINQKSISDIGEKVHFSFWPGNSHAYSRTTTSSRDDVREHQPNTLRPADVLRHRCHTTPSVAAAIAPLSSLSNDVNTELNNHASSCIVPIRKAEAPAKVSNSSSNDHSKMCQPSSTLAAVAAVVDATAANAAESDLSYVYRTTSVRRNSAPMPLHRLANSVPQSSSTSGRNDMIPLPQLEQLPLRFVVFSESRRESIFTRADDGHDMIPLDF